MKSVAKEARREGRYLRDNFGRLDIRNHDKEKRINSCKNRDLCDSIGVERY